jgi:ABC-type Fe3+-hydroxamate transport system substrate-binding protein
VAARVRVASLVPSVTETLLSWGIRPVACTRFCEQPSLRQVGGTKDPDLDALINMRPDVVVLDQEENRREDAAALEAAGLDVHVTAVRSLDDVPVALKELGGVVGLPDAPAPVVERAPVLDGARVFVPIWKRPWMTLNDDTYGASVLRALGAVNVFGEGERRYPVVSLEEATAAGTDRVLAPSEPYPFGPRHAAELAAVAPVTLVDGQDLFWWGARSGRAVRRLAAALSAATG